tara:strand:+ start:2102 stop:2308 length:207 start_codon:yes stop_codon:yes gene_type:complete
MDFKIDIKLLITLLIFATTLGGFYYTTQLRLDSLETEVAQCNSSEPVNQLKKKIQNLAKRIKKIETNQ